MDAVKGRHRPDELLAYCPTWSTAKKKGQPKANTREKGIADHIAESGKKKRKRAVRLFCKICHKYNHNTNECFKNPFNKESLNMESATIIWNRGPASRRMKCRRMKRLERKGWRSFGKPGEYGRHVRRLGVTGEWGNEYV